MADTGYRLPTGYTEVSGSPWTTPANIETETTDYASKAIAVKNTTYELAGTNFGFSTSVIPDDAIIETVNVRYRSYQTSTSNASTGGQPYISTTAGTEHTQNTAAATTLSWDATAERPGGGSWTPSDFRDGTLTVRLRAKQGNTNTSRTYYFDFVEVQVIFTVPVTWDGAALVAGAGVLAVDATVQGAAVEWQGEALCAGQGALAADASVVHALLDGAALLAGAGQFSGNATVMHAAWDGMALLAGTGAADVNATVAHAVWNAGAQLDGIGVLAVDAAVQTAGGQTWDGAALVAGAGELKVNATVTQYIANGAALLAGAGTLQVDGYVAGRIPANALLVGTGTFAVNATLSHAVWSAEARFAAAGTLAADSYIKGILQGSAALIGVGGFAAKATIRGAISAQLAGAGQLIAPITARYLTTAAFNGSGLFATSISYGTLVAAARFNGVGFMKATSISLGLITGTGELLSGTSQVYGSMKPVGTRLSGSVSSSISLQGVGPE